MGYGLLCGIFNKFLKLVLFLPIRKIFLMEWLEYFVGWRYRRHRVLFSFVSHLEAESIRVISGYRTISLNATCVTPLEWLRCLCWWRWSCGMISNIETRVNQTLAMTTPFLCGYVYYVVLWKLFVSRWKTIFAVLPHLYKMCISGQRRYY